MIRWFIPLGWPIVVADSSTEHCTAALQDMPGVTHLHRPGGFEVYLAKLAEALALVKTPLVAMCADDDFITLDGLKSSVGFLKSNADYSFAQGYAYQFQRFNSRIALWPILYTRHTVEQDDWVERVDQAHSTIYYGVNRTDVLFTAFEFLARQDFGDITPSLAAFADTAITLYAARVGKFKRINQPFALREYSPIVSAVGTRPDTITSRNIPDFYAALLRLMTSEERNVDIERRLRRTFARDYAGQITYDLKVQSSRKNHLTRIPPPLLGAAEHAFRVASALRTYARREYRPFLSVYSCPDYGRFKSFVLEEKLP